MSTYLELNALAGLLDDKGQPQFEKDHDAARAYFLEHVNPKTMFFHDLKEKVGYMFYEDYWDEHLLDTYTKEEIVDFLKKAYSYKYRFDSFVGAYKFYNSYACKTRDGKWYLERFEDRVAITCLAIAQGVSKWAPHYELDYAYRFLDVIMTGQFQPATPTFLNAGRSNVGDLVSCFLLRIEDNMESIADAVRQSLQLSKRGGGVSLLLSNLREAGSSIKGVQNAASGVLPVMKLLEDSFSYANQLGARQGAGAVYLHAHHPDIMEFLDTKRENADEKIRIKTLSLGVVIPDITFELARKGEDMYLFSPYDVETLYGKPLSDISITEYYDTLVEDPMVRKKKISARKFFQTIAELQFESGYPYIMFEDTANKANPIEGRINMSNLCSEILQVNEPTFFNPDGTHLVTGSDISCNLGSLNIAKVMQHGDIQNAVQAAVWFLTAVSLLSEHETSNSVALGNHDLRSIGLGQMNLHGYLAQQHMEYGSPEALEFFDAYLRAVRFYALETSMSLVYQREHTTVMLNPFKGFERSKYATGEALQDYCEEDIELSPRVAGLFKYPTEFLNKDQWADLSKEIQRTGLANAYLLAIPPTGNISYVNGATPSIHPVTSAVEIRKEGKMGRVYYPAPGLSKETLPYYTNAYDVDYTKLIDTYAVANKHTDQGCSMTLFLTDQHTTRDLNKAQIYAWRKGVKTIYYLRVRQAALEGTEVAECLSCAL